MASSVTSLMDEEEGIIDVEDGNGDGEKEKLSAALEAGLMMNRRRMFISGSGLVGLAPWNAGEGDVVCALLGCRSPVVLRRDGKGWVLIGEVFVEGFMDGEAMVGLREGEFVLETFEIR